MAEDKIVVEIVRDYWTGSDERVRAGDLVEVRTQIALELVEGGIARRLGSVRLSPRPGGPMADFYTGEPYSGDWRLISDNPVLGVRQFRLDIRDGQYVVKTEHYVTDALLDLNAERRAAQAGRAWGEGQLVANPSRSTSRGKT